MTQHTPGPWIVDDDHQHTLTIVAPWSRNVPTTSDGYGDYRGIHVAALQHQNDNECVSKAQALANARLIAAAPELLEQLKSALDALEIVNGWATDEQANEIGLGDLLNDTPILIAKAEAQS